MSAAFDTLKHAQLIKELVEEYAIEVGALEWFKSYLSDRTCSVLINSSFSEDYCLDVGVPQGSILGPLLFILFTKKLEKVVKKYGLQYHCFADDIQLLCKFYP